MRLRLLPAFAGLICLLATAASAANTGVTGSGAPIDNVQPSLVMSQLMTQSGIFPCRDCGTSPAVYTMGGIRTFATPFDIFGAPSADGRILSIASNTAMFSLLGTNYGGNGINNFALPDLVGRAAVGAGMGPGLSNYSLGQQTGFAQTVLTVADLPAHVHDLTGGGTTGSTGGGLPFDNRQPTLGLNYQIAAVPSASAFTDPVVGTVGLFAGGFEPGGWLQADGRTLSIADYPDLFLALGTTYGGDGVTTFVLPDLRGRTVVGAGAGLSLGDTFGSETVTLTGSTMAPHDHSLPGGGFTGLEGGGQPYDNAQPSIALEYLIAVSGIFPCLGCDTGSLPFDTDPVLSEIIAYAGGGPIPRGWMLANGQILSIASNTALFSLLGTTYGGDGVTTFALPDLRGRTILGAGEGFDMGEVLGQRLNTLSVAQLPAHDHSLPAVTGVPEPGLWLMLIAGFGLAGCVLRRQARLTAH
jgi:microcystin-dependent protein